MKQRKQGNTEIKKKAKKSGKRPINEETKGEIKRINDSNK